MADAFLRALLCHHTIAFLHLVTGVARGLEAMPENVKEVTGCLETEAVVIVLELNDS